MPQGLQIWNAGGQLVLDTTRRVGSILGFIDQPIVAGVPYNGSVTDAGFSRGGPFYHIVQYPWEDNFNSAIDVLVTIVGTTLSWQIADNQYGSPANVNGRVKILYGYF